MLTKKHLKINSYIVKITEQLNVILKTNTEYTVHKILVIYMYIYNPLYIHCLSEESMVILSLKIAHSKVSS